MRRYAVLSTAVLLAASVAGRDARAQGFGVYEHDACTMARAGTGVAAPCSGGSAVLFNPAGIVETGSRWNTTLGNTLITLDFNYRDSASGITTDAVKNNIPIPAAYITRQLSDRLAVGFGVYAPYGLKVEWPTTFEGRFLAYSSDLKSINFQPTVAYRVTPWLRLGAAVTYVHTAIELRQRVDLSEQEAQPGVTFAMLGIPVGTDFADATLSGSGNSWGGHFGVIIEPHPRISIGARYLLKTTADITADASFTQIPTGIVLPPGNPIVPGGASAPLDAVLAPTFSATGDLRAQGASSTVPLPSQLVIGVALKATPRLTLLFDWQQVGWSAFEALPLNFEVLPDDSLYEDYNNTNGYRFGAEYRLDKVNLRAGYLYHEAAAPAQTVTPLLPEGERTEFTAGVGIALSPRLRLDLAYQHITQADRRGRVVEPAVRGPSGAAANTGIYTGGANLFGASFALGF